MRPEPRLRLEDRFTHLVRTAGALVVVGDEDSLVLEHPLAGDVVSLLDGHWTAVEIAERLADDHPAAEVHFVILHLLAQGLAREVDGAPGPEAPSDPAFEGGGLASALASLWRARGQDPTVTVPSTVWQGPGGCRLVLTDDYLSSDLARACSATEADGRPPVLLAGLAPHRVWLGPILSPDGSCLACLQDRLRLNLTSRSLLHVGTDARGVALDVVRLPSEVPASAFAVLADAIARGASDADALAGRLFEVPLGSDPAPRAPRAPRTHRVPRLPHCPVCGDTSLTAPGPDITLTSRPRTDGSGGGYRIVSPQATLETHTPLVSPLVGVVRRIEKVPVDAHGLVHVYTASHAHHYGVGNVRAVKDDRRDHSGGKGRTDIDARTSALCESLERFSGVHRGTEPTRRARRSDLGDDAFAPNELMHFSEAQYAHREEWNATQSGFQSVPVPYHDEPIEWCDVRSLQTGRIHQVPAAHLFLGFGGEGARYCAGDSNGLAGGNCLEEAILQAFLELAERDAIALWWYNRVRRPGVDLSTVDDPWVGDVIRYYGTLDRDLWVLDLTTDLGIPTFAALSGLRRETEQDIIFGFGAHLDARIALSRALTELNQMLPTIFQTRDVRRRRLLPDFADAVAWWDEATREAHPYLLPSPHVPASSLPPPPHPGFADLRDDVMECVRRAQAADCDVLVYALTRPDVGFPVAKVTVPGLRHFWRRLGPGRLYDLPVRLGWLGRANAEHEMNPVSMFV